MKMKLKFIRLSLLAVLFLFKSVSSFSQDLSVLETFMEKMNEVFSEIDTTKLSTGILIERAPAVVDLNRFNINSNDSSQCSVWDWLDLHNLLYLAHVSPADVRMKKSFIDNYPLNVDVDDPIPLGIIFYDYNKINDNAISNGHIVIDSVNMKIRDVSGPNIIPFDTLTCFAAAFLTSEEITQSTRSFYFNSDFLISNKTNQFDELYIDFDDGQGFTQINTTNFTVYYSSSGEKTIKIKAILGDDEYFAYISLAVEGLLYEVNDDIRPDFGPTTYSYAGHDAEYGIWYGCNNGETLKKPYLVVSGFDPYDRNRLVDEEEKINLYSVSNKNGFLDKLRDDGYDVIIYRPQKSGKSVVDNAMNLAGFIQKVNNEKITDNELIIAGASMGGLLVRYALTYMENKSIDHQTKLFISVDSPQEGATVPLGFQFFVERMSVNFFGIFMAIPQIKTAKESALDTIAAREMLLYHYLGQNGVKANPASERQDYLSKLNSIGSFPHKCRNIAISMGSGTGTGQGFGGGQLLVRKTRGSAMGGIINAVLGSAIFWDFEIKAVPDHVNTQIFNETIEFWNFILWPFTPLSVRRFHINVDNTMAIENAPGAKQGLHNLDCLDSDGLVTVLQLLGNVYKEPNFDCFIPSYSALGIPLNMINNNPHANLKTLMTNSPNVSKPISGNNNLYMSLNNNSPSYFDFMYIENVNDYHIYHPDTHEGVFSDQMLETMKDFSSPSNLYVDNKTIPNNKAIDYSARSKIIAGNGVDDLSATHGDVVVKNGGSLDFYAGVEVTLKDGFHAQSGSDVTVAITDFCDPNTTDTKNIVFPKPKLGNTGEFEAAEQENEWIEKSEEDFSLFDLIKTLENPVVFYPNPVQQTLNISSTLNKNQMYIYNMNGNLLYTAQFDRNTAVDVSGFSAGIYIVKVIQENGNVVQQKIIKE